ncbi:alpha/beta hydrolase [Mangrovicoccus algicola]|uniref:Alpha/beta hydrolase n=1 Tax=Mangrovicoccus algicola TaxID=2771008 RepID=A0A8J7CGL5_9RHOB|nr:alpha/beta hydrolase [Mangrovicoccus algicola]MBE3637230.1 alpha/beta hydrolase [Mangrovicoccus algicola]
MDRRTLLGAAAMAALSPRLSLADGQTVPKLKQPLESYRLWPEGAPGGAAVEAAEEWILRSPGGDPNDTAALHVRDPILMVRRPRTPNGAAVLMMPGGGYRRVAVSRAGGREDQWFEDQGFTTFIMTYRLPADPWAAGPEVALQDGQRALRFIRHNAGDFGIDPARVAVAGFSAGGHVAGWTAERFARAAYEPVDEIDTADLRPMLAGLFFPVVTMMPDYAHGGSRTEMFGEDPQDIASQRAASLELNVPPDMPPTFLAHSLNDPFVPPQNSSQLAEALRDRGIPTELHLFETGGHGIQIPEQPLVHLELWLPFAKRHGLV